MLGQLETKRNVLHASIEGITVGDRTGWVRDAEC